MENEKEVRKVKKDGLLLRYVPIIAVAFIIAMFSPVPITSSDLSMHISGIATGFGIAYIIIFLTKWRSLDVNEAEQK